MNVDNPMKIITEASSDEEGNIRGLARWMGSWVRSDFNQIVMVRAQVGSLCTKEQTFRNGMLKGIEAIALGVILAEEEPLPWIPPNDGRKCFAALLESGEGKEALLKAAQYAGQVATTRRARLLSELHESADYRFRGMVWETYNDVERGIVTAIWDFTSHFSGRLRSPQVTGWVEKLIRIVGEKGGSLSESEMLQHISSLGPDIARDMKNLLKEVENFRKRYEREGESCLDEITRLVHFCYHSKTLEDVLAKLWSDRSVWDCGYVDPFYPASTLISLKRDKEDWGKRWYELNYSGWWAYEEVTRRSDAKLWP